METGMVVESRSTCFPRRAKSSRTEAARDVTEGSRNGGRVIGEAGGRRGFDD
jgi:hypothetical protein